PHALLLALTVPSDWRDDVAELADGVGELAASVGASVVGGNLTAGDALSLTITVIGSARSPMPRTGIRPGNTLYVTGTLGGPQAALAAFLAGSTPPDAARARFARPVPRIAEARWLAGHGCVAGIDISDGLLADAENLAAASAVRIVLDAASIPLHPGVSAADAATGGEEYELLVAARTPLDTVAFTQRFGLPLTRIGTVVEGAAAVVADGLARVANPAGHSHFSA
ncbi:MAG: thiamine-monophosphate kinase, partial [Gemmatimonadaceae bacterium]|nr:thiamine-monophosphate kinase [Gemmatimonadaceae bacterium]